MVANVLSIARGQFFYGWIIVAVGFTTGFVAVSSRFFGFAVFLKPVIEDLGWSRAMYSGVFSFSNLVEAVVAPFVGPILDRRGARALMIFGIAVAGAGFVGLGFLQGLWDFYLFRGVFLAVGFTCCGPLAYSVAISNWFIRKRGRAVAIGLMGTAVGGAVMSPLSLYLIAVFGWRAAWVILGVLMVLVVIPPVALFMKRRPEDVGLLPDGDSVRLRGQGSGAGELSPDPRPLTPEEVWTRREAMRTGALWLTILAFGVGGMAVGTAALHLFPYLTDIGLSEVAAAGVYSAYALASALFKPVWGILIDKYTPRRCGVAAFAICAVAMPLVASLSLWPALWFVYFTAILVGFTTAAQAPVVEVLWANYFGRLSLGAIRTVASPFSIFFGAGGPLFGGWVYDRFGSYVFAWVAFCVTSMLGAILVFISRPPGKKPNHASARQT